MGGEGQGRRRGKGDGGVMIGVILRSAKHIAWLCGIFGFTRDLRIRVY